jgi:DinB superfamily
MSQVNPLKQHVLNLLDSEGAHISFDDVVRNFPRELRGAKPDGAPHTAWQLLEHMRIAQWDILEFSRDAKHISPKWPEGYWPESEAPPSDASWKKSIASFHHDLEEMKKLVSKAGEKQLFAPIPHGDGQTLLREALLIADHNSYHLGQLMFLKKMLETTVGR